MIKHVLITYKWEKDRPETKWLFWLEKKLQAQGFQVTMSPLATPNRNSKEWIGDLQATYAIPDNNVYLIHHDPGCLTILKYLEFLALSKNVEQALLVAGIPPKNYSTNSEQASPYIRLEGPQEIAIFSSDNPEHLQDIDAKLVVLYSVEGDKLGSGDKDQKKLMGFRNK